MTQVDVSLQIFRYKAGEPPHYDMFTVQVADTAHVIDVIDTVWAEHDHTLTFRRACHHSSCGSCAIRVNGVEKLPCITHLTDVWNSHSTLRLEPLRNFPVVSDLVVDVNGFLQRMSASTMKITREAETDLPLSVDDLSELVQPQAVKPPDNLTQFGRFENCIECGICMSACPTMTTDTKFWGPAGLAAVYRAYQESTDPDEKIHLLKLVDGEHVLGVFGFGFECSEVCPQAVDPAGKIMALRREITGQRLQKIWRK